MPIEIEKSKRVGIPKVARINNEKAKTLKAIVITRLVSPNRLMYRIAIAVPAKQINGIAEKRLCTKVLR
jgi:hypothetical protein